jgi:molecular chaperone GrpE
MTENDDFQDNPTTDATPATEATPPAAETLTPETPAAPPSPEQRVAALEAEKAEIKDRMLRIAAEFDNYKKRARKDVAEHEVRARETVLRDFLDIADNLERAIGSWKEGGEQDIKSVQNGVDLVLRLFKSKLERYSVTAIEAKGQPFDPRVHDAISQAPSADAAPGTVLHELQKGYRVGERLLRPAIVVVAKAPPAPPSEKAPDAGVDVDVTDAESSAPPGGDKPS